MGKGDRKREKARKSDWAAFEALVARIERMECPPGAIVTLDDRVPELVTGRKRQIDASIRYEVGSSPVFVMVECQKRKSRANKMWVEQLKTKKEEVGATSVLAVTYEPLGVPALEAARRFGIETRCLREAKDDQALPTFDTGIPGIRFKVQDVKAALDCDQGRPVHISLAFLDPDPSIRIDPVLANSLANDPLNEPFAFSEDGARTVTVGSVLNRARLGGWDPAGGQPVGIPHTSTLTLDLKLKTKWFAPSTRGKRQLAAAQIVYEGMRGLMDADLKNHAYVGPKRTTRISDGKIVSPDGATEFHLTVGFDERGLRAHIERLQIDPVTPPNERVVPTPVSEPTAAPPATKTSETAV